MTVASEDIVDQAIAWHLRLADADADEWHRFVEWLEADEAHQAAYDQVTMDDALIAPSLDLTAAPVAANDAGPPRRFARWAGFGGGAAAAALAVAMLLPETQAVASYTVETKPGETRTMKLDDGTTIEMNGGTKMSFRKGDARYAALEAGEATFHVRHDADHPFELQSGRYAIRDLGTVFNVTRDGKRLGVEVAEGSVAFEPNRQNVTLTPGMALTAHEDRAEPKLDRIAAHNVGGWRRGVVSFRGAPIESVANAVARSTGAHLKVEPTLAKQTFTGTIHLTGDQGRLIPRVATLIGADWRRKGDNWMLTTKGDESR
ncbi:DUF4880 domain-containing protein [Sphingomonas crocodyli]|uniref:DUF4880 domain-containing protein n=1 Tax=Sphingomonas crocodyli TaxID=1979270 RepID=A0A437LVH7_9SPHN|nr:DUF4880 domain-containing protein [Sphingomonas crocodyli]